jgi:hypothetical protein
MTITQKTIIDDIKNLLTKFNVTDDSRLNDNWLAYKIDQVRADLISKQFIQTEQIDPSWISDLGVVDFYKVNFADDINVSYCACDISKTTIPQTVLLYSKSKNWDLGIYSIMSTCGKTGYYYQPLPVWRNIPTEHEYSKFGSYFRINTALYVNKLVEKLRILAVLQSPLDGKLIQSAPIASGGILSGGAYIVSGGQVIYDATVYQPGDTFTGGVVTTYTGSGKVYLSTQAIDYRSTDPYPVSPEMARNVVLEICTKEFQIEKGQIPEVRNDSEDDTQKG